MGSYKYRLTVTIPRRRLEDAIGADPIELSQQGHRIRMVVESSADETRPDRLILTAGGFETADQAWQFASSAQHALVWAGVVAGVPMLFGTKSPTSNPPAMTDLLEEQHVVARWAVHGIDVFDEAEGTTVIISTEGRGHASASLKHFTDELSEALDGQRSRLDPRVSLAAEVFMAAQREKVGSGAFLGLVTCLEVLSTRQDRSPAELAAVESAIAAVDARFDKRDTRAHSLRSALVDLKRQSIGDAIADLASHIRVGSESGVDNDDPRRFLKWCYNTRSLLVHQGKADGVPELTSRLSLLTRRILLDHMSGVEDAV